MSVWHLQIPPGTVQVVPEETSTRNRGAWCQAGPRCLVPVAGSKLLVACPLSRRGFFLAKKCVSGFLDLHFVRFVIDLVRFGRIWSDYPGSRIRIQAFSGLSSLPQGFFFGQNVRLRICGPAFCHIWSDFVRFVTDFVRFGQIWPPPGPGLGQEVQRERFECLREGKSIVSRTRNHRLVH